MCPFYPHAKLSRTLGHMYSVVSKITLTQWCVFCSSAADFSWENKIEVLYGGIYFLMLMLVKKKNPYPKPVLLLSML